MELESLVPNSTLTTKKQKGWLEDMVFSLLCHKEEDKEAFGSTEEMIDDAGRRAFRISTALGLVPGPLGMAAILPEVAVLIKLQINLIYRIGKYYGKGEKINKELILLVLGNAMGVSVGEIALRRAGEAVVVRSVNARITRELARKIGTKIIDRAAEKAVARWIPMAAAPLFGYFSRSLTRRIGKEARRLFSQEVETETLAGNGRG
jgi:hypothetical protein